MMQMKFQYLTVWYTYSYCILQTHRRVVYNHTLCGTIGGLQEEFEA